MMDFKNVTRLRKVYPKGTRIVLVRMDDPYVKMEAGMKGTVQHVDDAGQIHMKWDSGSSLALIVGVDDFIKEVDS